ncbi:MAG: hypothetical protein ABIJ12_02395 [bacterium]
MRRYIITFIFILVFSAVVNAQTPTTFEEAKELSIQQNKTILLEFFRED